MIRRPPRSTLSSSSAASDVYKRQLFSLGKTISIGIFIKIQWANFDELILFNCWLLNMFFPFSSVSNQTYLLRKNRYQLTVFDRMNSCLLYTSDAADEEDSVDLGGRRIIKKKKKKNKKK